MTATKICPDCRKPIHTEAHRCPHCHLGFPEYGIMRRRKPYPVARIALVALIVMTAIGWLAG